MIDKNEAIRQAMQASGISGAELGRRVSASKQEVSNVRCNRRGLSDETFTRWMAAMGQEAKIIICPAVEGKLK